MIVVKSAKVNEPDSGSVITFRDDNGGKNHHKTEDKDQGQHLDLERTSVNEWV